MQLGGASADRSGLPPLEWGFEKTPFCSPFYLRDLASRTGLTGLFWLACFRILYFCLVWFVGKAVCDLPCTSLDPHVRSLEMCLGMRKTPSLRAEEKPVHPAAHFHGHAERVQKAGTSSSDCPPSSSSGLGLQAHAGAFCRECTKEEAFQSPN